MYSEQSRLFSRPLGRELIDELDRHIAKIQKASSDELEALSSMTSRLAVPSLCRSDTDLKTTSTESGVSVAVSVPVEGDVTMLKFAPTGMPYRQQITVTMSDDLEWMLDGRTAGGSFHSGRWDDSGSGEESRGGFFFRELFSAGVATDEVRARVREVIDGIEDALQLSEQEIKRFETTRTEQISEAIGKRRSSIETATRLEEELGRGI